MDAIVLCRLPQVVRVQDALAACGYGRGYVSGKTNLACQIEVCHERLGSKKDLQKYLREELNDQTIMVR